MHKGFLFALLRAVAPQLAHNRLSPTCFAGLAAWKIEKRQLTRGSQCNPVIWPTAWHCNMKLKVAKQTVRIARRNGRGSLGKCSSNEEVEFKKLIPYYKNIE